MTTDDVIAGVRAVREAYAARFGFDPVAMASDLRERERESGRLVVLPSVTGSDRGVKEQDPGPMLQPLTNELVADAT